jgi:hypothetical protein
MAGPLFSLAKDTTHRPESKPVPWWSDIGRSTAAASGQSAVSSVCDEISIWTRQQHVSDSSLNPLRECESIILRHAECRSRRPCRSQHKTFCIPYQAVRYVTFCQRSYLADSPNYCGILDHTFSTIQSNNRPIDWSIDWLIGWLADWSIDWSIDWLIDFYVPYWMFSFFCDFGIFVKFKFLSFFVEIFFAFKTRNFTWNSESLFSIYWFVTDNCLHNTTVVDFTNNMIQVTFRKKSSAIIGAKFWLVRVGKGHHP